MNIFGLTIISQSAYEELLGKVSSLDALIREKSSLKSQLEKTKEEVRRMVDKTEEKASEITSLEKKIEELKAEVEAKDKELLKSGESLAEAAASSDKSQENNRKLMSSLKDKSSSLKKAQLNLERAEADLAAANERMRELEASLVESNGMVKTLQAQLDAINAQNPMNSSVEESEEEWTPEGTEKVEGAEETPWGGVDVESFVSGQDRTIQEAEGGIPQEAVSVDEAHEAVPETDGNPGAELELESQEQPVAEQPQPVVEQPKEAEPVLVHPVEQPQQPSFKSKRRKRKKY